MNKGTHSYVVVRSDLSYPQTIVQSCHACIEMTKKYISGGMKHPSLIVCYTKDEDSLVEIIKSLRKKGITFTSFWEPDIEGVTALCTEPLEEKDRILFSKFNLVDDPKQLKQSIFTLKSLLKEISAELKIAKINLKLHSQGRLDGSVYPLVRKVISLKHRYRHHHIAFCELRG
jgi:hypothetical protein